MFCGGEFERGKMSMAYFSNRILLTCIYIGAFTLLAACSQAVTQKPMQQEQPNTIEQQNQSEEETVSLLPSLSISKLSFISQNGIEIEVDPFVFEESWEKVFPKLTEEPLPAGMPLYTAIGWDKQSQPVVFQLYASGLKMGSKFYSGDAYESFAQWVKEYMGMHYFDALTMERMTLQALDIGMLAQISEEKATTLFEYLEEAVLQKGEARITSPLYPYYQLDIEYGGKNYVSVDIITPTLVSVQDGENRWYYQLSQSLLSELAQVIPLQDYSIQHIKHLFQAEGLVIEQESQIVEFNQAAEDPLKTKAFIHGIARALAYSKPQGLAEITEDQEKIMSLTFSFTNQEKQSVELYDDFFIFNNRVYDLAQAEQKIEEFVSALKEK